MARHNREARGIDQHGMLWSISYQPDWLSRVKISRKLPGDRRRSSLTLFRNPARRAEGRPGRLVRTGIQAVDGSAGFRVAAHHVGQTQGPRCKAAQQRAALGQMVQRLLRELPGARHLSPEHGDKGT